MSFFTIKELDLHIVYDCDLYSWKNLALINRNSYYAMNEIPDYRSWRSMNNAVFKNLKYFGYDRKRYTQLDEEILNSLPYYEFAKVSIAAIRAREQITRRLMLDEACRHGSLYFMERFGSDVNITGKRLADMFSVTCERDDLQIFRWLANVASAVSVEPIDCNPDSIYPIHSMIQYNSVNIMEWTLDNCKMFFSREHIFRTACSMGNVDMAMFILDRIGKYAAYWRYDLFRDACLNGHKMMAEWLLSLGYIDVTQEDNEVYHLTPHNHIKEWLVESVYGFTPMRDADPQRDAFIHHNRYRSSWVGCGYWNLQSYPLSKAEKIKMKERHPRKILMKRPIKDKRSQYRF